MTRVLGKRGADISQRIQVSVVKISPFERLMNQVDLLIHHGQLLPSNRRLRYLRNILDHVTGVILWKFSADKGGGSWKFLMNTINVEHPQSLKHVQLICEFSAGDSQNNMAAAMFHEGSPCKLDLEDIIHLRCVLLQNNVDDQMQVALVKNPNPCHHRHKPQALAGHYAVRPYTSSMLGPPTEAALFENRVATVDFSLVTSILLMYNTTGKTIDELHFVDMEEAALSTLTLKTQILTPYRSLLPFNVK